MTKEELEDAVEGGEGFCLRCGERQDAPEGNYPFGQCQACNYYKVLSAETLVEALSWLETGELE